MGMFDCEVLGMHLDRNQWNLLEELGQVVEDTCFFFFRLKALNLLRTGGLACHASGHLGLGSRLPMLFSMNVHNEKANCAISCHWTTEIGLQLICQIFRRSLRNCQVLVADLGLTQSFMAAVPERML